MYYSLCSDFSSLCKCCIFSTGWHSQFTIHIDRPISHDIYTTTNNNNTVYSVLLLVLYTCSPWVIINEGWTYKVCRGIFYRNVHEHNTQEAALQ